MIALIWAQARDTAGRPVIGAGGDIPWRVAEDFTRFRTLTTGHPVVMGRRTWDSLPRRPLPGRTNVVVTRQPDWRPDDDGAVVTAGAPEATAVVVATTLDEALDGATQAPGGDLVWIIGGAEIYGQALAVADRLEVTEIDLVVDGDAFAPAIDPVHWHEGQHGHGDWVSPARPESPRYRFRTYVRR
ncbi:Dihydrofolate reductase [Xylanimonas cellulosilytica DSM 15894]|uniref:Dihydrofolate reductase n=1 Tax=Xylanimonas cellulosilytica (strain DSM 15894 / JCM 12276 / CECT 5975 / KCTC 9989 / LMG 20990 / NBRC 107835 / XIL07) TaxID=446471 RepID=D1BYH5_XYLCX|nr:dihydrofolate reductase [Xylanimonas cellulosilytica]ACZ31847.1 Dihydrofolate reductase [Xylanimonas cellulosilytica DSM 15894]